MRPGVRCVQMYSGRKSQVCSSMVLTMFSSKKLLVTAAIRPSHLSVMLSPLLPHQSQAVYPPPAQYNDLSGYSIPIPPPHFTLPQATMATQPPRQPEHVMKAIIVHRFVHHVIILFITYIHSTQMS